MAENKNKQFERHQNTAFRHLSDANAQILRMRHLIGPMQGMTGMKNDLKELQDECLRLMTGTTSMLERIRDNGIVIQYDD